MTQPSTPPRRTSGVRKVILIALLLGVAAVFTAIGLLAWTNAKIDRVPAEELTSLVDVDGPRNILIVGTDSRENVTADLGDSFGSFGGSRTDVVMIVHFIPGERAQILSLPRDLKVEIPDNGTNKINAAYVFGGPDLLVQTVINNLEVDINNYVEIDFAGFAALVDAIGGIELEFDRPARDLKSGLEVDAGLQHLDGASALALARSRQYQELTADGWKTVGGNDIARTRRQQRVLLALFDEATSKGNAFNLPSFASKVAEQIRADESLSVPVILELGRAVMGLDSSDIEAMTLPVKIVKEDRSYVVPVEPDASDVLRAFRAGLPFPS
ncbi:MAG: LCP family protein [bacterium]|nr:LCP family protein [bacterium]